MESFIEEYISSVGADEVVDELLIERRVSPYATLRPGDLASLLKLHSSLPFPGTGNFKLNHGEKIEEIIKKEEQGETSDSNDEKEEELFEVTCRGADQSHVPAVYHVKGLRRHEFPVIGVYVDERVCPGFKYRVRRAGSNRFFYGNEARTLESVGMGYGKRLTFTGETLNNNDCFFWSDSDPSGFAFSIQAVDESQRFLIVDQEDAVVGESVVTRVHDPQEETSMTFDKDGVTKQVSVTLTCAMKYYHRHNHGLVELMAHEETQTVSGSALLHKTRRARKASLKAVENVYLQRFGNCKFIPDY